MSTIVGRTSDIRSRLLSAIRVSHSRHENRRQSAIKDAFGERRILATASDGNDRSLPWLDIGHRSFTFRG